MCTLRVRVRRDFDIKILQYTPRKMSALAKMSRDYPFLVFVYGTLKTGEPNHHLLQNTSDRKQKLFSFGKTAEKIPMVIASSFNIPFLLDCPGKGRHVTGKSCTHSQ